MATKTPPTESWRAEVKDALGENGVELCRGPLRREERDGYCH